ncbi:MAG: BBP7 family outer membrane beta-barrel protein [Rubripirellula sp.]
MVLSGDVIDRNIDPNAFNTGSFGTSPAFNFDDSSMWVQGLDLGLVIDM